MDTSFLGYLLLVGFILGSSETEIRAPPNTIDFFPGIKNNLTKVTWAHAVNSASFLTEVLKNSDIMMIEADVSLGTLVDDPTGTVQPVMAHPPSKISDISLKRFLAEINQSNMNNTNTMKGVKLDFKSIEVFEESLQTVENSYGEITYPMWINADILPGPVNSSGKPVDAVRFLNACKRFPAALLSTGWTTRYGGLINKGSYTDQQIADMLQVLNETKIAQSVTFPVRAGIAASSLPQMQQLLTDSQHLNSTLTIWSSAGDFVDIALLRDLILISGLERIYLDVPKEISDKLHLDQFS